MYMKRFSAVLLSILLLLVLLPRFGDAETSPFAVCPDTRGGMPGKKDVAVFEPFYGKGGRFTDRYAEEGATLATALGGTCTVYRGENATVDAIASTLQSCAVVILDSRGETDYEFGDDCTTYANTSYLCLTSGAGITDADYEKADIGYENTLFHHARTNGDGNELYYCIDGTTIADHMTGNAQNCLLWMAVDYGMATDGLCAPLRSKGVGVVYGYSQGIGNGQGDALYENTFFWALKKGASVRSAVSLMKRMHGLWDPSVSAGSAAEAKTKHAAFPIVVSTEDTYPNSADAAQTVLSTWKCKTPTFLYGDVNGDDRINSLDAALLLRQIGKLSDLSQDGLLAADVNADGELNAQDAILILQYIVRRITAFPADN